MATFEKLNNGKVRASVCINGIRQSKTLPPQKAKSWARERETELSGSVLLVDSSQTFGDLFKYYAKKVSPTKRGGNWEIIRLEALCRDFKPLCNIKLIHSSREDIEEWIKLRLVTVKSSTVNRELNLISHTLTQARRWRWMSHNPFVDLERPKNPPPRFRRLSEKEIDELCIVLGYRPDKSVTHKYECVGVAFLFAIETAMRAGEICSLTDYDIDLTKRVAKLSKTKNGDDRDVPLSHRAIELIKQLPASADAGQPLFQLDAGTLSQLFMRYCKRTTIEGLTFHDTRHEATTRLADKFHVLDLARITGHRDIKQLMTYYNKTAEELAQQLEASDSNTIDRKQEKSAIDYHKLAQELAKVVSNNLVHSG